MAKLKRNRPVGRQQVQVNRTGAGPHRDSRREAREVRGAARRRAIEESR